MGLIQNKNNSTSQSFPLEKGAEAPISSLSLSPQQKSFASAYSEHVVCKLIEVGKLSLEDEIKNALKEYYKTFEELLK
jgi:hypothetical protein